MKQYWQREREALERLGFSGLYVDQSVKRAVEVVIDLQKEIERLNNLLNDRRNNKPI